MKLGLDHWLVFGALLLVNALLAFAALALGLQNDLLAGQEMPAELAGVPAWALGLANAGMIVVMYGLAGAAGLWLGQRAGLPGMFRAGAGWRAWVWVPMAYGVVVGVLMVLFDRLLAAAGGWEGLPHPNFSMSLFASAMAGIGEEIVFRGFAMGLCAFVLCLVMRRTGSAAAAPWVANVLAVLAFIAGHLPTVMRLYGAASPLALPPAVLVDVVVLNGLVGLASGWLYARHGLVAAMGVHFWADVVWHVVCPLLAR